MQAEQEESQGTSEETRKPRNVELTERDVATLRFIGEPVPLCDSSRRGLRVQPAELAPPVAPRGVDALLPEVYKEGSAAAGAVVRNARRYVSPNTLRSAKT